MERIKAMLEKKAVRTCMLICSAVITALSVCFPSIGLLEWVGLIPLALVLFWNTEKGIGSYRRAYFTGLLFFWGYYAVIFHWFFYMYPLSFSGLPKAAAVVVVVVACFGLAFLQALVGAFVFPLFWRISRGRLVQKIPPLMPLVGAALWCVMEWVLTLTWAGVPWSRLALGQMKMAAVVQSASLFGSYFITFLIVLVNFLLAYTLYFRRGLAAALAALLFSANLLTGMTLLFINKDVGEPIRVAAVQPNVSTADKWDEDKFIDSLLLHEKYTEQAAAEGASIVVWPESAIPYDVELMPGVQSRLSRLADQTDAYVIVGAFRAEKGKEYNALYVYQPDGTCGEDYYYKQRLVPFGEFVPLEDLVQVVIPPLAELTAFADKNLTAGHESTVIKTEHGTVGALICFDSIYEDLTRESVLNGAELIVLSTNDSWFADSAALYMHNRQASLRAIESGRYIVRSANTGISCVITPTGEVLELVGANRGGVVIADVYARGDFTLYTRIGNLWIWLCIAFLFLPIGYDTVFWWLDRRKRKATSEK